MPSFSTVMRWVGDTKHPEFSEQYARGRECGLEAMADELLEIADQTLPRLRDGRIDSGRVNSNGFRSMPGSGPCQHRLRRSMGI